MPDLESQPWSLKAATARFDEQAASYCYRIAVHNGIDDSERVLEDCREHGDLDSLEAREPTDEDIAKATKACLDPPEGLEKEWCVQSKEFCDGTSGSEGDCAHVEELCADKHEPDAGPGGEKADASDSGCSTRPAANSGWAQLLTFMSALGMWSVRRPGRSHQNPRDLDQF